MEGALIDLVQLFPFLYDKSRRDFKNNAKKENAWLTIAQELNCTVETCRKLWQSLREKYSRERKIGFLGRAGCRSSWQFYDAMSFMDKHIATRKRYSNMRSPLCSQDEPGLSRRVDEPGPSHKVDEPAPSHEVDEPGMDDVDDLNESLSSTFSHIMQQESDKESVPPPSFFIESSRNKRKRKDETNDECVMNALSALTVYPLVYVLCDYLKNNAGNANKSFGQFVADTLSEISDPEEVKYKKKKITEILFSDIISKYK